MAVLHNDEEQIPLETDSADMTDSNNLLDEAFVALRSSSPFTRLTFIKNKMIPYIKSLETRPNATVYELLCLVIQLAPRYNDSRSRNSVINVLEAFYDLDSLFTINTFISLLAKDVDKCLNPAVAVSTSLILVEWTSALIVFSAKGRLVPPIELLEFQAKLLTSCIVLPLKPTLRKHAVVVTRRALKECFCQEIDGKKGALAQYFISELVKGDITSILLLGQIADVAYHTGAKDLVQENKKAILGLYLTKVLGSKKAVDAKISAAYNDFFRRFITLEELNKDILPSVEKALLRNPEVVLDGVLVHLFSSLSDDIDPSEMVFEKLLKSFLPLLKSSNTAVRLHSIQTFKNIVSRCKNQDLASTCISTILDASALANPEQRALCSSYLGYFPASKKTSTEILKAVESSYAKELYENVQMALSKAYMAHLEFLLKSETLPNTTITFFVERLKEKKVKLQFSWLSGLGSLILNSTQLSNPLSELAVLTSPLLYSVWQQVSTNPTQALQAGTVVSGLVCISVGLRLSEFPENSFSKMSFHKTCLDWTTAKPFPLWSRIYTKLTSVEEQIWNVTALQCIGEYTEPHLLQKFAIDWVLAMLYFTTEIKLHFSVRTMAIKVFSHVVGHRINLLDHAIVESFWILVQASEGTSSSVEFSSSNLKHFPRVIASLAVSVSDEQKNSLAIVLVKLLFLMSHPVFENIPNTQLWTDICLRVGQDPHDLVVQYSDKFMEIIYHQGLSNQDSVLKACEILVFVAPDVLTRRLIGLFEEDLSPTIYQGIGSLEIAIWKAPDDAPYINILDKSTPIEKNSKNYETEKWETEVRAQIAQKKGIPQKKLTKEEEKAIADQMAKEKIIRARVEESYTKAMKGLGIIRALCIGSQEGIEVWLARAIKVLLIKGLESTRDLVGDVGIDTYLKLSKVATSRLGLFSESVGTATLRSYTLQDMPEQFTHERSTELITRVLYKLRFTSEQRPFDVAPFIYTLPLLLNIVINNQLDDRSSEEYDEQLTLALEVLASNSSLLIDLNIDRESIFRAVLDLVQRSPQYFKKVKHYVVSTTELIKNNISPQEIDVLAKGSISPEPAVRTISLQSLDALDLIDMGYCEEIWIACQDDDMVINELANKIWDDNGLEVKEESVSSLLMYLNNKSSYIRQVASKAISASIDEFPDKLRPVWNELSGLYRIKAEPVRPQYDEYGMLIKESLNAEDPWVSRHGVANTLVLLADRFEGELLDELVQFLTDESLGDRNSDVRQMMLKAGLEIILVGHSRIEAIAGKLEEFLSRPVNKLDERQDFVQESVVILYGSLARHLKKGDPRIGDIMTRLISALKTPSEAVQQAVATCLSPLIKLVDVPQRGFVDKMLKEALSSNSYAERKGGAYGLAGVIKGYGISALKNCEVLSHLQTAIENRKAPKMRQGSLFCFEALSQLLGRLFEPFIASLLPYLVIAFGDPDSEVREASQECARTIMSNLSGHCVNVILPFLLSGLTEDQWRSKKGAIELLGSMAYCAPRQLSYSLPEIVPRLSEVLTDSHAQVRNSANQSLSQFGEVINNPEIQQLTPILLKALSSPNKYTDDALVALLKTAFVHYLDASSLALVMPILQRGLKERAAGTKKRAAQTLNGLISVVEPKELIPYLERLIPNLREVLVDPVPGTRATAAKCLGTFVEKLGEQNFPNLIDNLLEVLSSDASGVDRQGAAQGLSEVLSGLGLDRLNEVLPEILRNTSHPKEYVREGYISLLIYLPATFGPRFQPYLARIIPPVLSGLADESRDVSDQSLRAAKMIVANYAFKSVDLLLPELERGLFDDNWRIRQSSVQLIGDLLFKITGINTKTDIDLAEDDDAGVTETQKTALLDILGKERRDRLLAALYITRQDSSGLVRLSALHVWKAMVSNTPRMVKEVLPAMTSIIITNLASSNEEHRTVAAQTLGDIVRKLGESVLAQLVPVLQSDLESTEAAMRMGVCSALTEIMASCGQHQIEEYETEFIAAVRMALVDTDVSVRLAAARSFDSLQETFGDRVIDQILPDLLRALQSDQTAATALAALKEIMSMRANAIFPVLIPSLTEIPISLFNAKALASLAEVAGSAFTRRFKKIIHALVDTILQTKDQETRIEIENSLHQVTTSIIDSSDLLNLMPVLLGLAKHEDYRKRVLGCEQLGYFVEYTKVDYFTYVPELVQVLVTSLSDETCMTEASVALTAFVKTSRKVALDAAVIPVFNALQYTGYPGKELPGFCKIPKGINAVLPIFVQGLTGGTPEQREKAAAGMGAIIVRSNAESTKPFMAQITGPLIRVMGERTKREIKIEILSSLNLLMKQVNIQLKPFFPQLQRTFTKALADPDNSTLRTNAADALSTLVAMQTRVDPLIAELALGATNPDPGVKLAMYKAMKEVIARAGHLLSDGSQKTVWKLFEEGCENSDDRIVIQSARLLGSLMKQSIPSDSDIIRSKILSRHDSHSAILGLNAVLAEAPEKLTELHLTSNVILYILEELKSSQPPISNNSVLAAGKLLLSEKLSIGFSSTKALLTGLAETIEQVSSGNTDNKRLALVVIKTVSRLRFDMIKPHIAFLAPTVFTCVREIIIPVKLAAEQAYIAMFELVKNGPALFEKFLQNEELGPRSKAMKEYMDRVAMRLAALESERLADGGDHIGLDQLEDEHEIWQVGGFETDWTSE